MHNVHDRGNRGPFRPSARPSIHSQCPSSEHMGGYGLYSDGSTSSRRTNVLQTRQQDYVLQTRQQDYVDAGQDEVDCIRPPSALRKVSRRTSLTPPKPVSNDSISILGKSLPDKLPSYSHSSDEFGDISDPGSKYDSYTQHNSHLSSNQSYDDSSTSSQEENSLIDDNFINKPSNDKEKGSYKTVLTVVLGIIIGIAIHRSMGSESNTQVVKYDKFQFINDMDKLAYKYKVDDNEILMIQSGISTVFDNNDTASFIFIYNSKLNNFNPIKFQDFIEEIAIASAKYLRNETNHNHHISIDSAQLDMENHSEFIQKYREDVTRTGVMLVKEIDQVPSKLAMAFHYYCDEFNPLVKKSAIFFTLDLGNCSSYEGHKSNFAKIENCLMKKWHGVPKDNVKPLLTRVISIVVDVTSVF